MKRQPREKLDSILDGISDRIREVLDAVRYDGKYEIAAMKCVSQEVTIRDGKCYIRSWGDFGGDSISAGATSLQRSVTETIGFARDYGSEKDCDLLAMAEDFEKQAKRLRRAHSKIKP